MTDDRWSSLSFQFFSISSGNTSTVQGGIITNHWEVNMP